MKQQYMKDLVALEERVEELEGEVDRLRRLEERVAEIDARTDMLQVVEETDQMDAEQRSITLLQHMHRKLQRNNDDTVQLTRDEAQQALSYPDIHRTTYYTDMRRCPDLVGDEDICWYDDRDSSPIDKPRVVLDLTNGQLPGRYRNGGE